MTPLFIAVYRDQDSCVDIILDWMRSHDHEAANETLLTIFKRSMLLGLQSGSVKSLVKLSRILGIHSEYIDADTGPNREQVTIPHIGIAIDAKYPLRTLLADEGVDVPQPDHYDVTAISIATGSNRTDVIQTLLSMRNIEVQPPFLVDSLFRGNSTEVSLIANRLCSVLDSQSLSRFDILDEILFCALRQQVILSHFHDKHWTPSDRLTTQTENLADVDTFDIIWDTSVLDAQCFCLDWDFVDVILPRTTDPEDYEASKVTPSSNDIESGPKVAPNKESRLGVETLFLAVALRSKELVEKLVQYDPLIVHKTDVKGRTGLMAAVSTRSEDLNIFLLRCLNERSAASTINTTSGTGYSAIAYAVRARNLDQVLRLLDMPDFDVWSVFHEVAEGGYPFAWALEMMGDNTICESICTALLAQSNPKRLSQAAQQLQRLPKRVYLGPDRHRGYDESWKPLLCYAVIYGRLNTFRFLLDIGSDFEAPDGRGRTVLSYAEERRLVSDEFRSMVNLLLAQGADHLSLDKARRFPLWYAFNNNPRVLYDDDGDPDARFWWEHEQLQKLHADRPQFMSESEGVYSYLLNLAVDQCASIMLEFLVELGGSTFALKCLGTSDHTPLAKVVLSLNVVLPTTGSNDGRPHRNMSESLKYKVKVWYAKVKRFYMLLGRLKLSHDLPDKDGKTALCHALDRLYAEHCDNSHCSSLQDSHRSEGLTDFLFFIIEDLLDRNDSNPLMLNHEGYTPLDLAEALLDQLKKEAAHRTHKGASDFKSSSSLSITPGTRPSDSSKIAGSAETPFIAGELAAETALKALDGAVDLLDTLENEETSESLDCSSRREESTLKLDENTIIGGRTKMKAAIQALRVEWLHKNAMEGKQLGVELFHFGTEKHEN